MGNVAMNINIYKSRPPLPFNRMALDTNNSSYFNSGAGNLYITITVYIYKNK